MRHEEIQRIYKNHYFTSRRDMGGVKKLVGSVDVIVFFVNDSRSTWTLRAKEKYKASQKEAMQYVLKNARAKGVALSIRNAYVDATVPINCTTENYPTWSKTIISKYGSPDIPSYQIKHESVKRCTEAPILFVFNKPFRSGAIAVDFPARMQGEMSIISSQADTHTIVHELLHQFGAADLYYPAEVDRLIKRMGYSSIMATRRSMLIDSLTSYLIGRGHRKIAFIHGERTSVTNKRLVGFNRALKDHGIVPDDRYIVQGRFHDPQKSREATRYLMELPDPPTVIMYPDDFSYIGGMTELEKMELSVPKDVSTAGYDGIPISQFIRPRLTTYHQDATQIGRVSAAKLVETIENKNTCIPEEISVSGHILEGTSVAEI